MLPTHQDRPTNDYQTHLEITFSYCVKKMTHDLIKKWNPIKRSRINLTQKF